MSYIDISAMFTESLGGDAHAAYHERGKLDRPAQ